MAPRARAQPTWAQGAGAALQETQKHQGTEASSRTAGVCPSQVYPLNRLRFVPKSGTRMELFLVFALLEMVLMSAGARGE
ncbi:hypothetical protein D4764_09G0003620 [Takifugu flavidus]|uniref:Uncharacterized protein n=1 Tax=Takifugu flavidus TaxID=433684 RepID=A0A5C6MKG4_9TELE|nr:hypothetical protein D4764_09G0003620 [Takifugu flavidus]